MSSEDKKPGVFSRLFGRAKPGPTTVAEADRPDVAETAAIAPEIIAPEIIEPETSESMSLNKTAMMKPDLKKPDLKLPK